MFFFEFFDSFLEWQFGLKRLEKDLIGIQSKLSNSEGVIVLQDELLLNFLVFKVDGG